MPYAYTNTHKSTCVEQSRGLNQLNTPPLPISCIILDDTYALLSHNINFILVYKHLALPPPPPQQRHTSPRDTLYNLE